MFYTYVMQRKKDNKWYTGYTKDLRKRFQEHSDNKVFATKGRGPFDLVYYEACINEEDARMREKYLKSGMGKRYLKNRMKRFLSLTGFTPLEIIPHRHEKRLPKGNLSLTGFSLIELLSVMVIILILAGLFVGVSGPASRSAKKRKAEVMVSALEVAIGMYKADRGVYPPTDSGSGCAILYDYLTNETAYGGGALAGWAGPYMEFKNEDLMGTTPEEIKDPWGNPYNYQEPGAVGQNENSFDLWSNGPDGKTSTAQEKVDDKANW
ncbi:MAG: type II secretion system protein GspG [Candidatus Omnitrophota bacterium]